MSTLRELRHVRQIPGELRRRWFASDYFDLIAWFHDDGQLAGFHLHYDKFRDEKVFMWEVGGALRHQSVDDGDNPGRMKMTPLIGRAIEADVQPIADRFAAESAEMDASLAARVLARLHRRE